MGGGDTRDIAEPTYKTFNLPTRLSTNHYTKIRPHTRLSTNFQDFQQTTIQNSDRILGFQPTYKGLNLHTRQNL